MNFKANLLAAFLFACLSGYAQPGLADADAAGDVRVHMHLNRSTFFAGDTILFTAYLYKDLQPAFQESELIVELLNDKNEVLSATKFTSRNGVASGQITIPTPLRQAAYLLRAFTPSMLKQGEDYVFVRGIPVFSSSENEIPVNKVYDPWEIIPEHGKLIAGISNKVYFRAKSNMVESAGLYNNKQLIGSITTDQNGIGSIDFIPVAGEKYEVRYQQKNQTKKMSLPEVQTSGVVIASNSNGSGIKYSITGVQINKPVRLAGYFNSHDLFNEPISLNNKSVEGSLSTEELSSGILHFVVYDENGVIARKQMLVNSNDFFFPVELITDTLNKNINGMNGWKLVFPENEKGTLSVSVTDVDYDIIPASQTSIVNSLVLAPNSNHLLPEADKIWEDENVSRTLLQTHAFKGLPSKFKYQNSVKPFDYSEYVDEANRIFSRPEYVESMSEMINLFNPVKSGQKKTKKNTESTKSVNDRYTGGIFSSMGNVKVIDLINEPPVSNSGNVFVYAQGRISGVRIDQIGRSYKLSTNRSMSMYEGMVKGNKDGSTPVLIYMNEVESDANAVSNFQIKDIALVKYFPPGQLMMPGVGNAGIFAVYTKKPEDYKKVNQDELNIEAARRRGSLLWIPEVKMDGASTYSFKFPNATGAKRFRVSVVGVLEDGRVVQVEKVVE